MSLAIYFIPKADRTIIEKNNPNHCSSKVLVFIFLLQLANLRWHGQLLSSDTKKCKSLFELAKPIPPVDFSTNLAHLKK